MMRGRSVGEAAGNASAACAQSVPSRDDVAFNATLTAARGVDASEILFRALVARAAARFRPAGRWPYYFVRSKLLRDPVFKALLRDGRITSDARIVDLGCGLGVLPALLADAERCDARSTVEWPATWAPPPQRWTLRGFDLRAHAVAVGQRALFDVRDRVSLTVTDIRHIPVDACDIVVMLDVLHYIEPDAQHSLLTDAHAALSAGGTLVLRVADAAPNWRFRLTSTVDWCVSIGRGRSWPRHHFRSLAQWTALLRRIGFSVAAQPMSQGTPFANVLLVATKRRG